MAVTRDAYVSLHKRLLRFFLFTCLLPLFTACLTPPVPSNTRPSPWSGPYQVSPFTGSQPTGDLTFADLQLPSAANPLFASSSSDLAIDNMLWGQPIVFDQQFHAHADQLTEVPSPENGDVTDGGKTITMHLRPDLRWSDGKPIQASDFQFWWRLNQDSQTGATLTEGYDQIASIETPDTLTVVLHMKRPFGPYLFYLPYAAPEHAWGHLRPIDLQNIVSVIQAPQVTSGPYQIARFEPGKRYVLIPNRNYRSTTFHGPYLAQLTYQVYPTVQALTEAARQGKVTVAQGYQESDLPLLRRLTSQVDLVLTPTASYAHLDINLARAPWQDLRVRQALQAAINVCGFLRSALAQSDCGRRVNQVEPHPSLFYDTAVRDPSYDPARARQLLTQAGWQQDHNGLLHKGSQTFTLRLVTTSHDVIRLAVARAIQRDLRTVGIQVEISTYDLGTFFGPYTKGGILATGAFDLALFTYFNSAEPDDQFGVFHSSQIPSTSQPGLSNYGHVNDTLIDQALIQGRSTVDFSTRISAYHRFLEQLASQVYTLPLYSELNILTVDQRVRNLLPNANPSLNTWNVADWWLAT